MARSMLPEYPEAKRRAFARTILSKTLRMRRGESLLVETWSETLPWAESVVLEARILGARPMLVLEDEPTYWKSVAEAPTANVGHTGSHDWAALKASNAHLYFWGPMDTAREDARPASLRRRIDANDHEWFRLVQKFGIRSVRFDLGRTSEISARRYGVDVNAWRNELIAAATEDPTTLRRDGLRLGEALRRGREVRIVHPNGTDLSLRLAGRTPRIDDGVIDDADVRAGNVVTVVPSGVVTVAVAETVADGTFVSNATGAFFVQGREAPIKQGTLTFRRGRLEDYAFAAGGEAFRREFSRLGPGGDRPGFLSVGLHPGISSIPLLFDQERGTVTLAIGRNAPFGGATRTPRFVAFQSLRQATLEIDGRPVVDSGAIT
ncbi:MAG TPA: hypothetical protein VMG81_00560 [Thermoplasmata archaeon]|nr:hypothetical protein [Thermoplasmata archaeon]